MNKSFFETEGWESTKPRFKCTFTPASGWKSKKNGTVYMLFEDDSRRTLCNINDLVAHGLMLLTELEESSESSEDSPASHVSKRPPRPDSSDEDMTPTRPTGGGVDADKTQSCADPSSGGDPAFGEPAALRHITEFSCYAVTLITIESLLTNRYVRRRRIRSRRRPF